ncbi:MAG: hypothetical protein EOP49_03840 [Sphingobacteriales bacterium]|nr:MAG: hypothetical protein EOP49_03840 [Sphingobacteriales bacterium]
MRHSLQHIQIVSDPTHLQEESLQQLYARELKYLQRTLEYFDKVGIAATIIYNVRVEGENVAASLKVEAKDGGFRKILEDATARFVWTKRQLNGNLMDGH